jgi:phosphohistidine phosphatase
MELLFVRHADAVPEDARLQDQHRFLSSAGRSSAQALGDALTRAALRVTRVLSSPLPSAVQTAELVVQRLGWSGLIEVVPELVPFGRAAGLLSELASGNGTAMLVGHEPSMSALAGQALGQRDVPALGKATALHVVGNRLVATYRP